MPSSVVGAGNSRTDSLLAGILILALPKLLSYIGAVYLIVIGLVDWFGVGR